MQDLDSTVNVQRILDALGDVDHDDLSELAGLVDVRPLALCTDPVNHSPCPA